MKVTALIPDHLVNEVRALTHAKTITESLIIAMQEFIAVHKLQALNQKIKKTPLKFQEGFSAEKIRELNRSAV